MKLTLTINKQIADSAKDYAKRHNTSVSRLVEAYLELLTKAEAADPGISPLVESLSGVIHVDENMGLKKDYAGYLAGKYK